MFGSKMYVCVISLRFGIQNTSISFECWKVFGNNQLFMWEVQCYGKMKSHIRYS